MPIQLSLLLWLATGLTLNALRAPLWAWALFLMVLTSSSQIVLFEGNIQLKSFGAVALLGWFFALAFATFSVAPLRRNVLIAPIYRTMRRIMPRMSETARQALEAGTVGFEAEFFAGKPDWRKLRAISPATLTPEEAAFLDGPTEQLCRMIVDWEIRHDRREIPEAIWDFVKRNGFLGLRISKDYGGLGFSAQALSLVLGKIAARSPDVFAVLMIPNSLSLGELIEKYGTDFQKRHYLPRLSSGEDIPCLALTGPPSGSDAATMHDIGVVTRGRNDGVDTIGIRASWDKRYITLAPQATLVGVAFRVFDPQGLLNRGEDVGITIAIVSSDHRGVGIGRRHLPAGAAFPSGPIHAKDVFIPLTSVIGGEAMVGQGWRMMMECVAVSRAVALPACAAAGVKAALRVSTAYGRIRRQFGFPIGKMEGLEEPLARMTEAAYVVEAARAVTASMVSRGEKPSVISALVKYQATERLRGSVNDAMDLHGGRAVFDGPANYLQSMYQMVPATITIEGANIVTRALIAFTQGVFRSHPYLPQEINSCQDSDQRRGLAAFEKAFLDHISFCLSNIQRAFLHNITGGRFCGAPDKTSATAGWYRQLGRASRNFALVADLTVLGLGRALRTRQKQTGRLADALSELFLLSCVLKRYEDDGSPGDDFPIVCFAAQNGLDRFQEALRGTIDNFPVTWMRLLMRLAVFPTGSPYRRAPDRLGHVVSRLASEPGETRDRLTRYIYVSKDMADPTGLLEAAFEKAVAAEEIEKKVDRAVRRGLVRRHHGIDWVGDAVVKKIISVEERRLLCEVEALRARVIAVDDFDPDEVRPNYMVAGHNITAMQHFAKHSAGRDISPSSSDGPVAPCD